LAAPMDPSWLGGDDDPEGTGSRVPSFIGAWLTDRVPIGGSTLVCYGYSRETPADGVAADTVRVQVVGPSDRYVRVNSDRVVHGFSGAPALDEDTGRICGIVKASANVEAPEGGWVVPAREILRRLPELVDEQRRHGPGTLWFDLANRRQERQQRLFGAPRTVATRTPASLLSPAAGVVPFTDRPEVDDLASWCRSDLLEGVVRLLYAEGGMGKTRTAQRLCDVMIGEGWIAGFARTDSSDDPAWLGEAVDAVGVGYRLLLVIDYAQGQEVFLRRLLGRLVMAGVPQHAVRVLLLARSKDPWWQQLASRLDGDLADWALDGARAVPLAPLTTMARPATTLATEAFHAFARALQLPTRVRPPPGLAAAVDGLTSVLLIHATALDAAVAAGQLDDWTDSGDPLGRICDHEVRGWRRDLAVLGPFQLSALDHPDNALLPETLLAAPALAKGTRRAALERNLDAVVRLTGPRVPWQDSDVGELWAALHFRYGRGVEDVAPLLPDRVAEILVRRVFRGLPQHTAAGYVREVVVCASSTGDEGWVAFLDAWARARGCSTAGRPPGDEAYPVMDALLSGELTREPATRLPALVRVAATMPRTRSLGDLVARLLPDLLPDVVAAVGRALPRYPTELSPLAVEVYRRLLSVQPLHLTPDEQASRADLLMLLSARQADVGDRARALAAAQQGVLLWEDLATRDDRYLEGHAAGLMDLSARCADVDDVEQAFGTGKEALEIYRELAEADARYRPPLASCYARVAVWRGLLGHPVAAYRDTLEAIELYRSAGVDRRYDEGLAEALRNAAVYAQDTGQDDVAVQYAEQAVALFTDLAHRDVARYTLERLRAEQVLGRVEFVTRPRSAYLRLRQVALERASYVTDNPQLLGLQREALVELAATAAQHASEDTGHWLRMLADLGG